VGDRRLRSGCRPLVPSQAMSVLDRPDGEPLLHTRDYHVEAYRHGPDTLRLRGWLKDTKEDGLYLAEGERPLTVHHMVVDLIVEVPSMVIRQAIPHMATKPNHVCADVLDAYRSLEGLSIARGFTHKVRELFGGPRGCTHVTMLLQAMAPVAVQSLWAMLRPTNEDGTPVMLGAIDAEAREAQRREHFERNRNTCHVWAEDGPMFDLIERGEDIPIPLWGAERLAELGLSEDDWYARRG